MNSKRWRRIRLLLIAEAHIVCLRDSKGCGVDRLGAVRELSDRRSIGCCADAAWSDRLWADLRMALLGRTPSYRP